MRVSLLNCRDLPFSLVSVNETVKTQWTNSETVSMGIGEKTRHRIESKPVLSNNGGRVSRLGSAIPHDRVALHAHNV